MHTMTLPKLPTPSILWISYAFFFWNEDGWGSSDSASEIGMATEGVVSASFAREGW